MSTGSQPEAVHREPYFLVYVEERVRATPQGSPETIFYVRLLPGPFVSWAPTAAQADREAKRALAAMRQHLRQSGMDEVQWWQSALENMSPEDRKLWSETHAVFPPPPRTVQSDFRFVETPRRKREVVRA